MYERGDQVQLWKRYAMVSVACYVICVLDCMHRHQCIIRPENVKTPVVIIVTLSILTSCYVEREIESRAVLPMRYNYAVQLIDWIGFNTIHLRINCLQWDTLKEKVLEHVVYKGFLFTEWFEWYKMWVGIKKLKRVYETYWHHHTNRQGTVHWW